MKKLQVCTFLSILALYFLAAANPLKAHADTVTLTLENEGPGNNSGGVYTYPYNFSIDGSSTYTSLMCYIYYDEIYNGETWTATVTNLAALISTSSTSVADQYEELAYLYNVADTSTNAATVSLAQWAAWELFDPTDLPSDLPTAAPAPPTAAEIAAELTLAQDSIGTLDYADYVLYTPVANSQTPLDDGTPQSFIGAVTPEPSSFLLLGSGLLILAGFTLSDKRRAKWATVIVGRRMV